MRNHHANSLGDGVTKSFIVFKWELKKAFLNPLYVIVFLIIPILLLLLSTGTEKKEQNIRLPVVVGISAPGDVPIRTVQSDSLILIRSVADTLSVEEKKSFFSTLIRRGLLTGAVILSPDDQHLVMAGNDTEAEVITKWVSRIIRKNIADSATLSKREVYFLTEGIDRASAITLEKRGGMGVLWLTAVFVFGVALTGSIFAKSMFEERKGKLLEVFLTTCSPGALVWGKFAALFVFSILQFALLYAGVFLFTDSGNTASAIPLVIGGMLGISSLFFITSWYFFTGVSVYSEIGFVGMSFLTLTLLALPVWLPAGNGLIVSEFFKWIPFTMFQSSLTGILESKENIEAIFQSVVQVGGGIFLLSRSARLLCKRIDR